MKTVKELGFTFQTIPLEEAQNAIIAGDGNYADLKALILENLPKLAIGKALAFGLPNGKEIPETQRKGIATALNGVCKRAGFNWKVRYSTTRKLFICIPKEFKHKKMETVADGSNYAIHPTRTRSKVAIHHDEIFELRKKGMAPTAIATKLGLKPKSVRNHIYNYLRGEK